MATDNIHRNDIYRNLKDRQEVPAIPAATVVLLRERQGTEVLMLQKNANITFGGMWVFPGGRIDEEDFPDDGDLEAAARNAVVRETAEETGLTVRQDKFIRFAHWTPPPGTSKRFATWFFAAEADTDEMVNVDGGEILNHRWIKPVDALQKHASGDIDLVPPTWITLYHLTLYATTSAILEHFRQNPGKVYETRVVKRDDGLVAWRCRL